ncbi:MAG: hypothetical protein AB2A00_38640 [Myxococcota bacterium]
MTEVLAHSSLDSRRFNLRIYRGVVDTVPRVEQALAEGRRERADLLILRTPAQLLNVVHAWGRS